MACSSNGADVPGPRAAHPDGPPPQPVPEQPGDAADYQVTQAAPDGHPVTPSWPVDPAAAVPHGPAEVLSPEPAGSGPPHALTDAAADSPGVPAIPVQGQISWRAWEVPGYTTLKALGSGGFGGVVLARHDASGTLVAVKYLRRELLADPEFAGMFRAEAGVLASMDDRNIVRLYQYVESTAGAAIVMELVDGVSLRDILSRRGATSAEAALVVLQGSLLGLAAAHARGVVHRDYKPENVLVNGTGVSKLTDFGIAARAGDRPVPAGTLAYAPPEQLSGASASPAGDVYAATATFYECLTGHPPFTGQTAEALLAQHRSEPVPLEAVPAALRPLVSAGMAKDPPDRPADAAAFVSELRTVAAEAYGQDWEKGGRPALAEAALLLAALWPSGAAPAVQGAVVEQVNLPSSLQGSRGSRHLWHLRHLRHEAHLRHLRAFIAIAATAAVGAALGAVIAVTTASSHSPSGASGASSPSAVRAASAPTGPPAQALTPPCTSAVLSSALRAANVPLVLPENWVVKDHACQSGYALAELGGIGYPVEAVFKQRGASWTFVYVLGEFNSCSTELHGKIIHSCKGGPSQALLRSLNLQANPSPS
jgi:serine/threonine protein kinase